MNAKSLMLSVPGASGEPALPVRALAVSAGSGPAPVLREACAPEQLLRAAVASRTLIVLAGLRIMQSPWGTRPAPERRR